MSTTRTTVRNGGRWLLAAAVVFVSGYALVVLVEPGGLATELGVAVPLSGWLGDRVGLTRVYVWSMVAFAAFSALCGLAWDLNSIRQSGKVKIVSFRWGADKQLRDAVCDFAGDSRNAHPWAARLYNDAITRGKDHPHATRILARAWLDIIWRCWTDGVAYNPDQHNALQRVLNATPKAA